MPGKSRHRKGKYLPQGKKKESRQHFSAPVAQQQVTAQTHEPISYSGVSAPSTGVSTPMAKLATVRYPHVAAELRTIGILAGIMLIVLAALALVLP